MRNFLGVLSVFVLATLGFAQSEIGSATLRRTVTDPSGAAIPGAKGSVKSPATGLERVTESTNDGLFSFPALPVGTYDVSVEAQGFKKLRRAGTELSVGSLVTIDA